MPMSGIPLRPALEGCDSKKSDFENQGGVRLGDPKSGGEGKICSYQAQTHSPWDPARSQRNKKWPGPYMAKIRWLILQVSGRGTGVCLGFLRGQRCALKLASAGTGGRYFCAYTTTQALEGLA